MTVCMALTACLVGTLLAIRLDHIKNSNILSHLFSTPQTSSPFISSLLSPPLLSFSPLTYPPLTSSPLTSSPLTSSPLTYSVTRARSGLIVVGDSSTLRNERHWKAFIRWCEGEGCCTSASGTLSLSAEDLSRLYGGTNTATAPGLSSSSSPSTSPVLPGDIEPQV
jgi:hypothetical protein